MSSLPPVILLLVIMLIVAFLSLVPSIFAIFYHNELGKKSEKIADDLTLHFYLGVEIFVAAIFLSLYFVGAILFIYADDFMLEIFPFLLAGVYAALAILAFFRYFKKPRNKKSTELFLSQKTAANLILKTEKVKTRTDAFALGNLSSVFELWLTFPLYLASVYLALTTAIPRLLIVLCLILASLLPLFLTHLYFKTGHNLADLQRLRIKNKLLIRLFISLGFLFAGILILILGVVK